jgi:hypothetical protein
VRRSHIKRVLAGSTIDELPDGKTAKVLKDDRRTRVTDRHRKRIKRHLRIKAFFGTSENAVKTQVWIAVSVYVLVAIVPNLFD